MIRKPNRRTNFNDIYPNKAAFERKIKEVKESGERLSRHIAELKHPSDSASFSKLNLEDISTIDFSLLQSFNTHRLSDYICGEIETKIVPYSHGRIDRMLLTVPTYLDDNGNLYLDELEERHFQSLIKSLGQQRTYIIVCHPKFEQRVTQWFEDQDVNSEVLFVFSPIFEYSIWAQDAYIAMNSNVLNHILFEGILFPRYQDMTIADDVSAQTDTSVLQSYLYFQGGNVLGGPSTTLIGWDYIFQNISRSKLEDEHKVIQAFQQVLGTSILPLGGERSGDFEWYKKDVLSGYGYQPIFHLDMYVTPTGVVNNEGKEIVMLGRPKKAFEITGKWSEYEYYNNAKYDAFFEETEEQLEQVFEVKHLPILLTHGNLNQTNYEYLFYNLTFNNVVIENYIENGQRQQNVIIPTYSEDSETYGTDYGIRRDLEQAAEEIWASIGFEVKRMDGLEDLTYGSGAVHCITKVMSRQNY